MSTSVRSRRFYSTSVAAGTGVNVYVVPAGRTAVLRSSSFSNNSAVATTFNVAIITAASVTVNYLPTTALAAGTRVVIDSYMVLNPGDTLRVTAGAGAPVLAHSFGALLDGAPS